VYAGLHHAGMLYMRTQLFEAERECGPVLQCLDASPAVWILWATLQLHLLGCGCFPAGIHCLNKMALKKPKVSSGSAPALMCLTVLPVLLLFFCVVAALQKYSERSPDFKQKGKTGNEVALWISSRNTPEWVLPYIQARLPPPPPPRNRDDQQC
jgi:hypothetical protein